MRSGIRHLLVAASAAAIVVAGSTPLWAVGPAAPDADAPASIPSSSTAKHPSSLPASMLAALQRDAGLGKAEAIKRMAFQADAAGIDARVQRSVGARYAGAWLDADANTLHIAVTGKAQAAAVRAAGATPVVVAHTLGQLNGWKGTLDAKLRGAKAPSWYVDVADNSIVVNAAPGQVEHVRRAALAAGVPADALTVRATAEAPRTLVDVIGGNAYTINNSARCSVGFSVVGGFVTAGHCGRSGATTANPSGSFAGSSFPGNDYAWVRVAAGNTPVGAVNNYAGGTVAIAGATAAAVGATVCRSGSTTGWHCGTIQALNATVNYAEGSVTGLIRTNVCAEPGDSGGSLVAGNQAQGMTSGGSGNCRSGGTTYFQPVGEALQAYGLQLVTSAGGGNPNPPQPTGCTGYATTYTGSLNAGQAAAQPNGGYVTINRSGTFSLCLAGPSGADFDLYLQKWNGQAWVNVKSGTTTSNNESFTYSGTSGYYRYVVNAYSGSGAYKLGATTP